MWQKTSNTVKSCIMPRLMCKFSTFWCGVYSCAAFIWGRLMCKVFSLQNSWSSRARCGSESEIWLVNVTKLAQRVNKHFGFQKTAEFSPMWTILDRLFQVEAIIWVQIMCNLSLEKVRLLFQCGKKIHNFAVKVVHSIRNHVNFHLCGQNSHRHVPEGEIFFLTKCSEPPNRFTRPQFFCSNETTTVERATAGWLSCLYFSRLYWDKSKIVG